jgi:hypothetical protein
MTCTSDRNKAALDSFRAKNYFQDFSSGGDLGRFLTT